MSLIRKITTLQFLEAHLAAAQRAGRTGSDITLLMRNAQRHYDAIRDHRPVSADEARTQLIFFLNRARQGGGGSGVPSDDVGAAIAILEKRETAQALGEAAHQVSAVPEQVQRQGALVEGQFGGSLADYVAASDGRVSVFGTDYRYIATSQENAKFHDLMQVEVMNQHLVERIGTYRFENRARARLDATFRGDPQEYHYQLDVNGRPRVMRCEMKPVRSCEGVLIGAINYIKDVTEALPGSLRLIG